MAEMATKYFQEVTKNMTKAEACLWKYALKVGGMKGFTFRRRAQF